jgi:hypothetical protein
LIAAFQELSMSNPPIAAPAGFVPQAAVTFSTGGTATPVDADNPMPTSERGFQGASPIVPGTVQTPGRAVALVCSVAGTAAFELADGSAFSVPVERGLTILPFAVRTILVAGTTASAIYANLV